MRLGWWAAPLVSLVVLVNLASMWEIASALRDLRRHGERALQLETTARARELESILSWTTADLAVLVGSPSLRVSRAAEAQSWREEVSVALLLFLRGHSLVGDLIVRDAQGTALLEAGRPRGVPGIWVPGEDERFTDVRDVPLRRELPIVGGSGAAGVPSRIEARLDPVALGEIGSYGVGIDRAVCALLDTTGARLAGAAEAVTDPAAAETAVGEADWGVAGPWSLRCIPGTLGPAATLEPLVARHRTNIVLNLVVMVLAIGLGTFGLHQQRRRRELEDRARQEARVRELERQLFHAERLSTVGRLAAGMAHEINNPLEGISNYLRLASDAVSRGDADRAGRHLEGVRQGVDRAASIVRRVLDHADPSAALNDIVNLGETVCRAIEFVRTREEFSEIEFDCRLPADGLRVRGSAVMLGQVFLNLVINACEAQPGGGEVAMQWRRRGKSIEIDVADRGPGVPAARRSRIFEPFESTKRSAGLGLSICHSIVERHGGTLSFHEREGGGALFRVSLESIDEQVTSGESA